MDLEAFDFVVEYKEGRKNGDADTLSRYGLRRSADDIDESEPNSRGDSKVGETENLLESGGATLDLIERDTVRRTKRPSVANFIHDIRKGEADKDDRKRESEPHISEKNGTQSSCPSDNRVETQSKVSGRQANLDDHSTSLTGPGCFTQTNDAFGRATDDTSERRSDYRTMTESRTKDDYSGRRAPTDA